MTYSLEVVGCDRLPSSLLKIPICLLNAKLVLAIVDIYDVSKSVANSLSHDYPPSHGYHPATTVETE